MMKQISYYLIYGPVYLLSLLPFRLLYGLADLFFFILYYLVRYRRAVVRNNLTSSFPEKSSQEIKKTERQFYRWLCDYAVETMKLLSISSEKLLKHVEFKNVEQMEKVFDEGRNCSLIMGHYCNWEWFAAMPLAMQRYPEAVVGALYHPLYNKAFDRLFLKLRTAHGVTCVPKQEILRYLVNCKKENRRTMFTYISDQAPKWENIHLWLDFLNHDTPVFSGGERIMRKGNDAVFFVDIERPYRGKYIFTYKPLVLEAAKTEEYEITRQFFKMLEEAIHRQPAYYLWTHKRWKRTREEYYERFNVVNGHNILKDQLKPSER